MKWVATVNTLDYTKYLREKIKTATKRSNFELQRTYTKLFCHKDHVGHIRLMIFQILAENGMKCLRVCMYRNEDLVLKNNKIPQVAEHQSRLEETFNVKSRYRPLFT